MRHIPFCTFSVLGSSFCSSLWICALLLSCHTLAIHIIYTMLHSNVVETARRPLTLCWADDGICWWSDLYTTTPFPIKAITPRRQTTAHTHFKRSYWRIIRPIININEEKHAQFRYFFVFFFQISNNKNSIYLSRAFSSILCTYVILSLCVVFSTPPPHHYYPWAKNIPPTKPFRTCRVFFSIFFFSTFVHYLCCENFQFPLCNDWLDMMRAPPYRIDLWLCRVSATRSMAHYNDYYCSMECLFVNLA